MRPGAMRSAMSGPHLPSGRARATMFPALLALVLPSLALASSTGEAHFAAQLLNAHGMRGTISISVSRSISRGTAPAYTIRFGAAIADALSPPSNLLLSLPRGAMPLVLCWGSADCQWVATTPSVWEAAGERRMRGVDVRQGRALEEMLTVAGEGNGEDVAVRVGNGEGIAVGERRVRGVDVRQGKGLEEMLTVAGEGNGEDVAVRVGNGEGIAVGEGSDAVTGYGVRAAVVVGGEVGHGGDLVGVLRRSREYNHDIIVPRYPSQDPRLEVRLKGEVGELGEGLSGGMHGGAFMLGAFK
ncbi:unnamed protein product [Closterium sp. Naga37s-1]|nr:unnamed protein product [Closterium sp. Naga37s-1]